MVCKECGEELLDGTEFCTNCGTPVSTDTDIHPLAQPLSDSTNATAVDSEATNETKAEESSVIGEVADSPTLTEEAVNLGKKETNSSIPSFDLSKSEEVSSGATDSSSPFGESPSTVQKEASTATPFQVNGSSPSDSSVNQTPPVGVAPEGFMWDPNSQLYYTSKTENDPSTGQPVQTVMYYNPTTQQYQEKKYPLNQNPTDGGQPGGVPSPSYASPSAPAKPKKVWPIVVLICAVVVLIAIAATVLVLNITKNKADTPAKAGSEEIELDSWKNFDGDSDEKTAPPSATGSGAPFSTKKEDTEQPDSLDNTFFATDGASSNGNYYFLSDDGYTLLALNNKDTKAIPLIEAPDGERFVGVEAIGNYLFFCSAQEDSDGYIVYNAGGAAEYYYRLDHPENPPEKFYTGDPVYSATNGGYLYLMPDGDSLMLQIGLEDGEPTIIATHQLDIDESAENLYLTNFSIRNDVAYYTTYNRKNDNYNHYLYHISKGKTEKILSQDTDESFISSIIKDELLLNSNIDGQGNVTIGYYNLDTKKNSIIEKLTQDDYPISFMSVYGKDFYYQVNGTLYRLPLSDLEGKPEKIDSFSDFFHVRAGDLCVGDTSFYDLKTGKRGVYTVDDGDALYQLGSGSSRGSRSSTRSSSNDNFSPFAYERDVHIFSDTNVNLFKALAYIIPEIKGSGEISRTDIIRNTGAFLRYPPVQETYVDSDGVVDVGLLRATLYDIYLYEGDFVGEVEDGSIPGLIVKGDDVYLDPSWSPSKKIVSVEENERDDEEGLCIVTVDYADGSFDMFGINYYGNEVSIVSDYSVIELYLP